MKPALRLFVVYIAGISCGASGADAHDGLISQRATEIERLVRITEQPHAMADSTASLCLMLPAAQHHVHNGFPQAAYCNVYTTHDAASAIRDGRSDYPIDSLIVKTKFPKGHPGRIEIYTVMRKMEPGYDSDNGDWEYSVINGGNRRIIARGHIDSCIDCHSAYKDTGYVTRTYLKPDFK